MTHAFWIDPLTNEQNEQQTIATDSIAVISGVLFCIFSLLTDDTNSQPIFRWHGIYSLAKDRINICIYFVS